MDEVFLTARQFCPVGLLTHFASLAGMAPFPTFLNTIYSSLGTLQAAFPYSHAVGDITSDAWKNNSLDWAVINEAIRYSEINHFPTIWLGAGSYGIVGTFVIHGGIFIRGEGCQGSNTELGTAIVHFSSDKDLFYYKGDADPYKVDGSAGTGGGLENLTIAKANRTAWEGCAYTGGIAIHIEGQDPNHRPGEMMLTNILIYAEGSPASNWLRGLYVDGTKVTEPGTSGVRSISCRKLRVADAIDPAKSIWLNLATHFFAHHLQVDPGPDESINAGLTISNFCDDVNIVGCQIDGDLVIEDSPPVPINGVTNSNPIVVTTSMPHGLPVGWNACIRVFGVVGISEANGNWDNLGGSDLSATILSPTTFSVPARPSSSGETYNSGGFVTSTSPRQINVFGNVNGIVTSSAYTGTGMLMLTNGFTPRLDPVSPVQYSALSPGFVLVSKNKPCFQLRLLSTESDAVTGDGTIVAVSFNTLAHDLNGDFAGDSSPYSRFSCHMAGIYRFSAKVILNGLNSTNTWATLGLNVVHQYSNEEEFSVRQIVPSSAGPSDQYMSLQMTQNVYLYQGDVVSLTLQVSGASSKNAGFGISQDAGGSGFCVFDGELATDPPPSI